MVKVTDARDANGIEIAAFGAWYETPAKNKAHWRFIGADSFICTCPYLVALDHPTTDMHLPECKSCLTALANESPIS